ncbi:MAG: hypothetical protein Kow00128_23980 [Deltaproteobacteria bacterium]
MPAQPAAARPAGARRGGAGRIGTAVAACCACLLAGCSPIRYRLAGEEAGRAFALFSESAFVRYPVVASFSGVAEIRGKAVPLVAGIRSEGPAEERVGVYDPLGRAVLFVENRGGRLIVARGPAAEEFPPGNLPPVAAGPVSLGGILSGAPGYPVEGGETGRTGVGAWVYRDRRQFLVSDPDRRVLMRAQYDISGARVTVTYPGRKTPAPPDRVEVEVPGARILLRRDAP